MEEENTTSGEIEFTNDSPPINPEERLKQLTEERNALKLQVMKERKDKLENKIKLRKLKEEVNSNVKRKLRLINQAIFAYNRLRPTDKYNSNILATLSAIIEAKEEVISNSGD